MKTGLLILPAVLLAVNKDRTLYEYVKGQDRK